MKKLNEITEPVYISKAKAGEPVRFIYAVTPNDPRAWRISSRHRVWKRSTAYTAEELLAKIASISPFENGYRFMQIDPGSSLLDPYPTLPGYYNDRVTPKTPTFYWATYKSFPNNPILYVKLCDDTVWYWGRSSSPGDKWVQSVNLNADLITRAANGQQIMDLDRVDFARDYTLFGLNIPALPLPFTHEKIDTLDLPAGQKWTCDTEPTKCAPTPTPEVAPDVAPEVNKNPFVMETPEWCKPEYQLDKVADKIFKAGRAHELGGLIKTLETLLPLLQKQLADLKKESEGK